MTIAQLLLFLLAYYFYFGLLAIPYFKGAQRQIWEALIPGYNVYVMTRIIQRPWWWLILALLPVVGNVMILVIYYEILHVFRLGKLKNLFLTIITAGLYFAYLGQSEKLEYQGRDIKEIRKHISELASSIIFAVVAASVIRAFTFEAFTIPTPSMEKSLMVGDFLFVSKIHYGVRLPMTPFSLPLVHNKVPATGINSYTDAVQFPYLRLPALQKVERNDPIVFNYPAEDIRPINMDGEIRPIDKREHYVKRAVGMPGDTFSVSQGKVLINGKPNIRPDRTAIQMSYEVSTREIGISPRQLKRKLNINLEQAAKYHNTYRQGGQKKHIYVMDIPTNKLEQFRELPGVESIKPYIHEPSMDNPVFPNPHHLDSLYFPWSRDNYGPLWIPAEGATIELNQENYYKYRRAISFYEGQELERKDGQFFINGSPTTEYTFKQDYYFGIGDNRHSSDDSRFWGFIPADHIVGKPVFIWMSYDKFGDGIGEKIRYDRVFTTVNGDGERRSYFWPFAGVVLLIYIFNTYRRRKKRKAA